MIEDAAVTTRPILEDWIERYYPDVYRLALTILDDPDEAEDAAQDSFVAAERAFDSFRFDSSPKTWLFSIAINTCRSRMRRWKTRRALVETIQSIQAIFEGQKTPEEELIAAERDDWLRDAVRQLDEKHRVPVVLYYLENLPVKEVARVMGIREGTVHSRLFHARSQLLNAARRSHVFLSETTEVTQ